MFEQFFADYGLPVLGGAVFIGVAWLAGRLLSKGINYLLSTRLKWEPGPIGLLSRVVSISIVVLAAIVVLEELDVEIASLLAALGIFGFAIALGMRTTTTNFFTGVMLSILQPYKVGEYIEGERVEGYVESISLFHTVVVTDDGTYVAVPNAAMWARSVKNLSRGRPRRIEVELTLDRTEESAEAIAVIQQTMQNAKDKISDIPPTIRITDVTAKRIKFEVGFWADAERMWGTRTQLTDALREALAAAGLTVVRAGPPRKKKPSSERKKPAPPPADDEV